MLLLPGIRSGGWGNGARQKSGRGHPGRDRQQWPPPCAVAAPPPAANSHGRRLAPAARCPGRAARRPAVGVQRRRAGSPPLGDPTTATARHRCCHSTPPARHHPHRVSGRMAPHTPFQPPPTPTRPRDAHAGSSVPPAGLYVPGPRGKPSVRPPWQPPPPPPYWVRFPAHANHAANLPSLSPREASSPPPPPPLSPLPLPRQTHARAHRQGQRELTGCPPLLYPTHPLHPGARAVPLWKCKERRAPKQKQ